MGTRSQVMEDHRPLGTIERLFSESSQNTEVGMDIRLYGPKSLACDAGQRLHYSSTFFNLCAPLAGISPGEYAISGYKTAFLTHLADFLLSGRGR